LSKYVFILPAVVIGSLIFGLSNASESKFDQNKISEKPDLVSFNLPQQDTSTTIKSKRVLKTDKGSVKTIKIEQKNKDSMALIDTLEDGALDISKLGDWGKMVRVRQNPSQTGKEPLYVIDGKIRATGGMIYIDSENIERMNVLKGASATSLYGEKGRNGVVELTTKSEAISDSIKTIKGTGKIADISVNESDNDSDSVKVSFYKKSNGSTTIDADKNVLYIVNGKKISKDGFDKLDFESVDSVKIFKDKKTLKSYGAEEKDGVIEVIIKKAKK